MSAKICECKENKTGGITTYPHKIGVLKKIPLSVGHGEMIILGTYAGWVSLTNPHLTWNKESMDHVPYLPKGTCVEYTSEV